MRKDFTIEKLMLGGEKVNITALAKQYGCCWKTIYKRLNLEKYKKFYTRLDKLFILQFFFFLLNNNLFRNLINF